MLENIMLISDSHSAAIFTHTGYPSKISANRSKALSKYQHFLRSYYANNSIMIGDKLSIAPCSEFINLALIVERGIDESKADLFSKATFYTSVDEIQAYKAPLCMDDILTQDSKVVLVEGPPGIGKSALCWELCRKWDTLTSLHSFKIVLLLKLRERRVQNATTLNAIFYHVDKTLSKNVVKDVVSCEGNGVLFIFDGFDELPSSVVYDKSRLIMSLISGKCLPNATRLITSRPSAFNHTGYPGIAGM